MDLTNVTPSREIFWNVPAMPNAVLMYLAFAVSLLVFANGFYQRYRLWRAGKPEGGRFKDLSIRLSRLFTDAGLQRSVNRDKVAAFFHLCIYLGFLVLLFTTTMVFIDHDLGIKIYQGNFYLLVTLLSDFFGLLFLIGLAKATYRRYSEQPDKLHSAPADRFLLLALAVLLVQGFLLEALRIKVTQDPWATYSFVGNALAQIFWPLSDLACRTLHFIIWWSHALTFFACVALLPYSKFLHLLTSPLNIFFAKPPREKAKLKYPGDIEKMLENADTLDFNLGVSTIKDLSWKQRLDLDSCTSCGRCQDVCPAYNTGKVLSPKWLILDTREHLLRLEADGKFEPTASPFKALDRQLLSNFLEQSRTDKRGENPLVAGAEIKAGESPEQLLAGELMPENVFWSCTTCRACMEVCPVGIEHVDLIVDVRRAETLLRGNLPAEAQSSLRAIETRGNPFGPRENRAAWAEGLEVPILKPGDAVDVLYWVGCVSSYDKRKQKIARDLSKILNASGFSWGILGERECCSGDPARRLGDENLFQTLAKTNLSTLQTITFKTVVTNCPHCLQALDKEYQDLEASAQLQNARVVHHSVFIRELLAAGKLELKSELSKEITYHDPCYLGRYNDVYDEPREVLVQLGGKPIREMEQSREKSFCCGAGGGHYFMDLKTGSRVNVKRCDQAAETGASVVATSCPFCLQMMEDGAKLSNREDSLEVKDIAELLAENLLTT